MKMTKLIYYLLFLIKMKKRKTKIRFSEKNVIHFFTRDTFIIRYTENILFYEFKQNFSYEDIIIKVNIPFKIETEPMFMYQSSKGVMDTINVFSNNEFEFELEYMNINIQDDYLWLIMKVNGIDYMIKIDYQELFEYYETNISIEDMSGIHIDVSIF